MKTLALVFVLFLIISVISVVPSIRTSNMIKCYVDNADEATIGIYYGPASGTGMLVKREGKSYVWTCGHVVEIAKFESYRDRKNNKTYAHNAFNIIEGRKDTYDINGELIESEKFNCRVVKYSKKESYDLALLEVESISFPYDTKFYLNQSPPERLSPVFHVGTFGAWGGQKANCAVTLGVVSRPNTICRGIKYDLISCPVTRGCSGGGAYLQSNGECIGMVEMMASDSGTIINPTRRMRSWAEKYGVGFAIDPSKRVPTKQEWAKIPVEDEPEEIEDEQSKERPSLFDIFKIK